MVILNLDSHAQMTRLLRLLVLKPRSLVQEAVSVIETDCEVDFAPPLDYVEPNRAEPPQGSIPEPDANGGLQPLLAASTCLAAAAGLASLLSLCNRSMQAAVIVIPKGMWGVEA